MKSELMRAFLAAQAERAEDPSVYITPHLNESDAERVALELLRQFDGLPASVIRQVLRKAEFWLGAVTVLDCGEATEFARAVEGWTRDPAESL